MDRRTFRVLEYDKIIDMLQSQCLSELGKEMARDLSPSASKDQVVAMQEETREAETIVAQSEKTIMDTFTDISGHIKRAKIGAALNPREILDIARLLRTSQRAEDAISEFQEDLTIIPSIASELSPNKWLYTQIDQCIEDEDNIADRASDELFRIRRRIKSAHTRIRERLNSIVQSPKYQKHLQEPIVTRRNDRYVIPVRQESRGSVPGLIHDQSSSGATLFIEPMAVVEANNEIKKLIIEEEREIERILLDLTGKIMSISDEILANMSILTRLDFILAKGKLSRLQRGVCPRIVEGQRLIIKEGRHPLIPRDEVVPISVNLGYEFNALVITGPNTGGKTVTLKTIGLFVLMAQSGLHIPAGPGTEMGIFSNVYADIGDEQSIEQSLSTFSSHMINIVKILKNAESQSLTLFDELGAGTDPTEGAALAMSILSYLNSENIRVVATTHYSELKAFAMTEENMENASMEFDVETLRPTFKLLIGMPGKSNAFEISKRLGLPDHFIEGAKGFLTQEDIHFEDLMRTLEEDRKATERGRREVEERQQYIEQLQRELETAKGEHRREQSDIIAKSRQEAKAIVQAAKEEADSIIRRLNSLHTQSYDRESRREAEQSRRQLQDRLESLADETATATQAAKAATELPKNLKLGDTIYIDTLSQRGQVLTLPSDDGELQVQVGIMKVAVHISDIRQVEDDTSQKIQPYRSNKERISVRNRKVQTEVDLRGYPAEEAIIEVDRFLDDSFLLGLGEVTIIHGKGTGVLRNRIQEHLKGHPHIKSFRLGKYGEGESGVTVVSLK